MAISYKSKLLKTPTWNNYEHIEDLIFNEGVNGIRKAILFLRSIRDSLGGHSDQKVNLTVKWDGAPAVFAGIDPSDGQFFVSKKGIFNKNPKVYKSKSEIKADLSGDLQKKFMVAFEEFSKLGIRDGVFQGDLMFTRDDLKTENIDGIKHVTFQPNTIVYAVPVDTRLGKEIARAKIGVVWHTSYSGSDFTSMKASFGKSITKKLKSSSRVWMDDATFHDATGIATFSDKETKELTSLLSDAGKLFNKISSDLVNSISENPDALQRIKAYNNSHIRNDTPFPNPRQHVKGLYRYLNEWIENEVAKRKTDQAKEKWRQKGKEIISTIFSKPTELHSLFELMNKLIEAKEMVVNKLNEASSTKTFVKTKNGLRPTNPEGYVAVDHIGNAVKLVDRFEFSRANFSPVIIKGWN